MPSDAIIFDDVTKSYDLRIGAFALKRGMDRLKNGQLFRKKAVESRSYKALDQVSFVVKTGERVGIIGANGAGKSTTLKLINGVTDPSQGRISVNGSTGGLIELGAGFNPELSGRDNIYLNSSLFGWSSERTRTVFDDITSFAELTDFIDVPVKKYSSGMTVRLAFAIAISHSPDIILLDEVMAVGDIRFREKCLRVVDEYMAEKTVIFVSHSFDEIEKVCDRVLIFDRGRLAYDGEVAAGRVKYYEMMGQPLIQPEVRRVPVNLRRGHAEEPVVRIETMTIQSVEADGADGLPKGSNGRIKVVVQPVSIGKGEPCRLHLAIKQARLGKITEVISGGTFDFILTSSGSQVIEYDFSTECLHPTTYCMDAWVEALSQSSLTERLITTEPFTVRTTSQDAVIGVVNLSFRPVGPRSPDLS